MRKYKSRYFIVLMLLIMIVLHPVSVVLANTNRLDHVPRLNDFTVEFDMKELVAWNGWLDFEKREFINGLKLSHRKLEGLDYSDYYLFCDFEVASMHDDGTITYYWVPDSVGFVDYDFSVVDDVLMYLDLKDGYFEHYFDYQRIVTQSTACVKQEVNKYGEKRYTYNSVITAADFYLVRMSDGECGNVLHCEFFWDEDFYAQECVGVSYSWRKVDYEEDEEEDNNETDEDIKIDVSVDDWYDRATLFDKFRAFIMGLPEVLYAIIIGAIAFAAALVGLIQALFPFIPNVIWFAFGGLVVLSICIGLWKLFY